MLTCREYLLISVALIRPYRCLHPDFRLRLAGIVVFDDQTTAYRLPGRVVKPASKMSFTVATCPGGITVAEISALYSRRWYTRG